MHDLGFLPVIVGCFMNISEKILWLGCVVLLAGRFAFAIEPGPGMIPRDGQTVSENDANTAQPVISRVLSIHRDEGGPACEPVPAYMVYQDQTGRTRTLRYQVMSRACQNG